MRLTNPGAVGALGELKNQITVINNVRSESKSSVGLHLVSISSDLGIWMPELYNSSHRMQEIKEIYQRSNWRNETQILWNIIIEGIVEENLGN